MPLDECLEIRAGSHDIYDLAVRSTDPRAAIFRAYHEINFGGPMLLKRINHPLAIGI